MRNWGRLDPRVRGDDERRGNDGMTRKLSSSTTHWIPAFAGMTINRRDDDRCEDDDIEE